MVTKAETATRVLVPVYNTVRRWLERRLADVPEPTEDEFYANFCPGDGQHDGEVIDTRSVEVRSLRKVEPHTAWQVRFASTDLAGEGSSVSRFDGSFFSGLGIGVTIGIDREFPEVDLDDALTGEAQSLVASAADMTVDELTVHVPYRHWQDQLTVDGPLAIPGFADALRASSLGHAMPIADLYIWHPIRDQLLDIAATDELIRCYRKAGVSVQYQRMRVVEHIGGVLAGAPRAIRYLDRRFAASRL